ncbi:hypothetical protein [Sphingomonas crusticola]|uniref:hypothetical protein n=1 Tax=Sphingomonas crusticola TaxID=1697973 RepID=UPI0013C2BA0B|nr:hypothetical protein [Sphingomonas crusticola]
MLRQLALSGGAVGTLALGLAVGACSKVQPQAPAETARTRAEAKRHKDACASTIAYDRMKRAIFSQASRQGVSHPTRLATLEEFAFVRMEDPVVTGFEPTLDLTHCRGRFILDVPPGSAPAFGGEHRLQADITYTAQGAADASGLVYAIQGAEPIVGKLAAFNLADASFRPLPAVDVDAPTATGSDGEAGSTPVETAATFRQAPDTDRRPLPMPAVEARRTVARQFPVAAPAAGGPPEGSRGEDTVRTFYNALGAGNGELASAQVVPAKRSSRAYSPDAISRFYGRLSTPLQLTGVSALSGNSYRVTYHYAGAGIRCNGSAVVRLIPTGGRLLIRSITAGSDC